MTARTRKRRGKARAKRAKRPVVAQAHAGDIATCSECGNDFVAETYGQAACGDACKVDRRRRLDRIRKSGDIAPGAGKRRGRPRKEAAA